MYSPEIEKVLKRSRVKIGDTVEITKDSEIYKGILMPSTGVQSKSVIILKLGNGYNVGMKYEKSMKFKVVKRGEPIEFKPANVKFKEDPNKPSVSVLGCGGTIVSRVEYTTGAVYPAFSPKDMILSLPELKEIANIDGRKIFDLASEDFTAEHWKIIAREVVKEIKSKADGVVLMQGTDTLHFTSAVLSFMLQNLPVPVVLVGAQRSGDRGSSDNMMNLVCATLAAAKSDVAEVSVCMHATTNDNFCNLSPGTKVRKMHTSRRDAFQTINVNPYAKIWYTEKRIEYLTDNFRKRGDRKLILDDKINPNVGLIYTYPGIKPEFFESLKKFYDGIVVAATGLGHVPTNPDKDKFTKSLIPSIKKLVDSGIPVVIAPQTLFGRINLNVYKNQRILKETGIIGDGADWTPETALVKLMWVLGHTKKMKEIKEMMEKNIAGEISEQISAESFLV